MNEFSGLYDVRPMRDADKNFILATFLRGLYYGDSWYSLIPKRIFMDNYKAVAQALVSSPNVFVNVACLKDAPDVILGYSVVSSDYQTLNWVYVKKAWRLRGIARALVPSHPTSVSHLSAEGKSLLNKINNPVFDPFTTGV